MTAYPPRLLTLVTPPQYEPLTLAEVKLFLRVDGSEEDSLLVHLLVAARERAEAYLRKSLLTQTWQLQQSYTDNVVHLPLGPVQAVMQVQVVSLGTTTTLAAEQYEFKTESSLLEVNAGIAADRVSLQYRTGYADPSLLPGAIKQAILHAVAHAYHHRENAQDLPAETKRMLADYREIRI